MVQVSPGSRPGSASVPAASESPASYSLGLPLARAATCSMAQVRATAVAADSNSTSVQERPRLRVAADELELGSREPPVEREEDRADPLAGELDFEDVGVVVGKDHDSIVAPHPEPVPQPEGRPTYPFVELPVGETPARGEVVDRFAPGGVARVVGDPVGDRFTGGAGRGAKLAHDRTTPSWAAIRCRGDTTRKRLILADHNRTSHEARVGSQGHFTLAGVKPLSPRERGEFTHTPCRWPA